MVQVWKSFYKWGAQHLEVSLFTRIFDMEKYDLI